jgi:hypothetical protein
MANNTGKKKRIIKTISNVIVNTIPQIGEALVNKLITPNLTEKVSKKRLEICSSCEYISDNKCKKCGCFLDLKTSSFSASCPLNKWKSLTVKEAEEYVSE